MRFRKKINYFKPLNCLLMIFGLFLVSACGGRQTMPGPALPPDSAITSIDWSRVPPPPAKKDLVAVAGFENKSTYSADRLWDTSAKFLSSHLLRTGYFRVVEWEEMKRLFDWDTLSQADIIKSPDKMKEAHRILLCEHFISGAVTRFNVNTYAQTSAMSKAKTIDTTVRVDLILQDAQTGEYLSSGKGEHTIRQTFGKGQVGTWDSSAGDDALDMAIGKALFELISTYGGTRRQAPVKQDASGVRLN